MGTMRPLTKHTTTSLVIIANKPRYQWKMNVPRVLKTNLLHLQMEKIWWGMSIWGVPKFKPILSMMGIIIALSIRIRSYRYWMRLIRRSYGCATKTLYETILCSQDLWARILILQRKWRALSGMEDFHVRLSKGQYKYSTAVLSMGRIKRNIDNCKLSLHDPW